MSKSIELVKQLTEAFKNKDKEGLRALLHDKYTFQGPLMQMQSPDEAVEFMSKCPMKAKHENTIIAEADGKVLQVFDWVVTEPFKETFRMCSVVTIKDQKILKEELIYDSSKFPKDFLEKMNQEACSD